ncbi:Cytosolic Fe-S cluster assembly factor nar1 [Tulasnella sp. 403]|nr:Cytosolic Fe-S cluster assembly factor nar1 [Tulasnella sp. 403]
MTFSGALTLTDLNDFITPSQACIKPVEETSPTEDEVKDPNNTASTQIEIDATGAYHEVLSTLDDSAKISKKVKKLKKAEISLNDCLACSGCITSAESVLITAQSHIEVYNFLASNPPASSPAHRIPVLSIAPQSLASLAVALASSSSPSTSGFSTPSTSQTPADTPLSPRRILRRVQAFCTQELGFHRVYDTTFARHIALLEHTREFIERRDVAAKGGKEKELVLPMISSACPGWVCYVEKTHAEMIPFLSRTKSPQQIMGTLVKNWMGKKWGKTPDQVYHVTVMPCYDKKLEASRKDFYNETYATRDVDCVLTTGELQTMMQEKGWDLSRPVPGEELLVDELDDETALPELLTHAGTSSGSYLHTLINTLSTPSSLLTHRVVRTSDYEEYVLKDTDTGEVIFKGAKCYGFRNLQNVVRKVGKDAGVRTARGAASGRMEGGKIGGGVGIRARRRAAADASGVTSNTEDSRGYDYVEVMACPGGCVNGGGQIRPNAITTGQGSSNYNSIATTPSNRSTTTVDSEGFARDWASEGVMVATPFSSTPTTGSRTPAEGEDAGKTSSLMAGDALSAKWGDKVWTSRVEAAYWGGDASMLTPPASPGLVGASGTSSQTGHSEGNLPTPPSSVRAIVMGDDIKTSSPPTSLLTSSSHRSASLSPATTTAASAENGLRHGEIREHKRRAEADKRAVDVLVELCRPTRRPDGWNEMDDPISEGRRRDMFRTQFRAVESENVVGLTVQW